MTIVGPDFDPSRLPWPIPGELAGRVAVVTGAGRGMGRAVAERLAAAGAAVAVNDLSESAARSTASALAARGATSIAVPGDVTRAPDVAAMASRVARELGAVHILVNAAGVLRRTPVFEMDEAEWDFVLAVNLKGTFLPSRAVLPAMREAGWGRIVNFSSTAGKTTSTLGSAAYTASKHAVLGFTRHLAMEEASYGITVNAVCPGLIDTEMVRGEIDAAGQAKYAASFPITRLGDPAEVAELVAFLASDRAAYITGAALDISGGDLMV